MSRSAGGLSLGDVDGDGRADILWMLHGGPSPLQIYLHRANGFVSGSEMLGASRPAGLAAAMADLDGDGDEDILAAPGLSGVIVYRNDGGTFSQIPLATDPAGNDVVVAMPADVDRDGMLDIVLGVWRSTLTCVTPIGLHGCAGHVEVYRQVAPWNFQPLVVNAPPRWVQSLRMFDWDGDGVEEILVANDLGMFAGGDQILRVVHASDGTISLTDVTGSDPFGAAIMGMGINPIDLDSDGVDELFIANMGFPLLFQRQGGTFVDVARSLAPDSYGLPSSGAPPHYFLFDSENEAEGPLGRFQDAYFATSSSWFPTTKWAPIVFDYDDDGHQDLFIPAAIVGLPHYPELEDSPPQLLRGASSGCLTDVSTANHVSVRGSGVSAVTADFDDDGDLDLAVVQAAATDMDRDRIVLLRNDNVGGHSLTVVAHGLGGAREGIGTIVEARTGSTTRRQRIDGHSSYVGSGLHVARFGLGAAMQVDEVVVHFIDGTVVRRSNVPAGTVVIDE